MNSHDSPTVAEGALCARFEQAIQDRWNSNTHLVWRGRNLTADCLVQIGSVSFLVRIEQGRMQDFRKGLPLLCSWTFAIRGSADAWAALWQDTPPPGWHDIFALSKRGEMVLEGNLQPLMANLQFIKDVVTLPRNTRPSAGSQPSNSGKSAVEPIVGRYMTIRIRDDDCRIY